jgi:hypothetical protein
MARGWMLLGGLIAGTAVAAPLARGADVNALCPDGGQVLFGDFNRDRMTDLLCHYGNRNEVRYTYSNGGFGAWGFNTVWTNYCTHSGSRLSVADFNGDGRDDLLCHDNAGSRWV